MARPVKTPSSPDLRATIASVAEALFAERGFDGTCIRAIGKEVGATTGLIYHYYGSKEDLYLKLMETAASDLTLQIEAIAAGNNSPQEKVGRVVRVFLDSYRARPQHFQLVQRAIDEFHPAVLALAERWFSRVYQALETITKEGTRKKIFKPFRPYLGPFIILSLTLNAVRNSRFQERMTPGLSAEDLLATLEKLILTLLVVPQEDKHEHARRQRAKRMNAGLPRGA